MNRTLHSVEGNRQRLDGGAMFGNVPKALWSRWLAPDHDNRIPLNCRAMLVRDGDRNLLFETGIGAFFEPKLRDRFGVQEAEHVLLESLRRLGLSHEDIDCVILSHLHFDHAGGLLRAYDPGQDQALLFPNATFVVSDAAWDRAQRPHPRDRASFISGLPGLLQESGRLRVVGKGESETAAQELGEGFRFHFSEGHTPGLMLTEVVMGAGPVVFAGDLVPGVPWVHLPVTMGYDRFPELVIDEKRALFEDLATRNGRLFLTHDADAAVCGIGLDEGGRWHATDVQGAPVQLDR